MLGGKQKFRRIIRASVQLLHDRRRGDDSSKLNTTLRILSYRIVWCQAFVLVVLMIDHGSHRIHMVQSTV